MAKNKIFQIEESFFREIVEKSSSLLDACKRFSVYPNSRNSKSIKKRIELLDMDKQFAYQVHQARSEQSKKKVKANPKQAKEKKKCIRCRKIISDANKTGYCRECFVIATNAKKIDAWLETGDIGYKSADSTIRNPFRDYIYNEQNGKCAICGIDSIWNGKELHFVLDHINGDASQSNRENLRLICPNCDSQLDTFKSRNKNSKRVAHKKYLQDNKL